MQKRVVVVLLAGMAFLAAGFLLTGINRSRDFNARMGTLNNLRELGQFCAESGKFIQAAQQLKQPPLIPGEVPAGTIVGPDRPAETRLSWAVAMLARMNAKRFDTASLAKQFDPTRPWDDPQHLAPAQMRLPVLTSPGRIPEPLAEGRFATNYVGNGGLDNSAGLPEQVKIDPRSGAFHYDRPTPLQVIYDHDGLSSSALFLEVSRDLGPWIRGGPSTVRTLDLSETALPALGADGQFGGNHDGIVGVSFADGSARFLTDRTAPAIVRSLMTIAGQESVIE